MKQDNTNQIIVTDQFTPEERDFITLYEQWCEMPEGKDKNQLARVIIDKAAYLGIFPCKKDLGI